VVARSLVLLVLASGLALAQDPCPCPEPPDSPQGEQRKLQGKWALVSLKIGNKEVAAAKGLSLTMEITKDKLKMTRNGKAAGNEGTFRLGSAGKRKHLDLTSAKDNKKSLGIYKLEKDELTICFPQKPGGARPKDFDGADGSVAVFRKVK
jgi:uncharacterized protein (TIGR03067 family)